MINSEYDTSYRSIQFLYQKVTKVLKEEFNQGNIFCPDLSEVDLETLDLNKCVNVLLLGSFVRSMFEMNNWPFKTVRLWVLSSAVKKFLVEEFNLEPQDVAVIPRDKILKGEDVSPVNWNHDLEFVYAGRLNEAKNIEALIHTVHSLQKDFGKNISLTLIGESDDQEKIHVEFKERKSFSNIIDDLINSLDWHQKPKIMPFQDQEDWVNGNFQNPVYISLSTNIFEDFGVSAQQALNKGWPIICSGWGGHLDIQQEYIQVPFSFLTSFKESKERGKLLASYFLNFKPSQFAAELDFFFPSEISMERLRSLIHETVIKNGTASFCLFRSEWNNLWLSKLGIQFFNRYRSAFRSPEEYKSNVLIVSDYYNFRGQFLDEEKFVTRAFDDSASRQSGVIVYSYIELASKRAWEDILKAETIYIGIPDFKEKLSSSYQRICDLFEEKDIVTLDARS